MENCTECDVGYYEDLTKTSKFVCEQCSQTWSATKVSCVNQHISLSQIELERGFWRGSQVSKNVRSCSFGQGAHKACKGGTGLANSTENANLTSSQNDTASRSLSFDTDNYCHHHHWGPLCKLCDRDYYHSKQGEGCIHCGNQWKSPRHYIVLSILAVFTLAALALCVHKTRKHMKRQKSWTYDASFASLMRDLIEKVSTKVKILATTFQITSQLFPNCNLDMPLYIGSFDSVIVFFNFDLTNAWPLECVFPTHNKGKESMFRYKWVVLWNTLYPMAVSVGIYAVYRALLACRAKAPDEIKYDRSVEPRRLREWFMYIFLFYTFIM